MDHQLTPLYIAGQRVTGEPSFEVVNPADETIAGRVTNADADLVNAALEAARDAFPGWSATPLSARRELILGYAELLESRRDELLALLVAETGKPLDNAAYDFGMLVECLRFFVAEAERVRQEVIVDPDGRFQHTIRKQPLGVVSGLLAWNFPLLNLGYKLGPALAAGCTAVIRPSRQTPLATLAAAALATDAGIPAGVINVVASDNHEATRPMLTSPIPAMVTMIGSTEAGLEVIRGAATSIKHYSLELGGNSPVVVYPDADLANAAEQIIDLKFTNTGQVCVSPNRCFVHESIYDRFVELAAERTSGLVLGAGAGEGRRMGPLISAEARERGLRLVREAVEGGASIVCGGSAPDDRPGFWMQPTILRDAEPWMACGCDEIFAPILPVIRWTDADDPIALANDTPHGLAAYVFTADLATALRASDGIQAGSVCVNEPHYAVHLPHGGLKQSGVGKDCSSYSLEEYLTVKRVSIRLT